MRCSFKNYSRNKVKLKRKNLEEVLKEINNKLDKMDAKFEAKFQEMDTKFESKFE